MNLIYFQRLMKISVSKSQKSWNIELNTLFNLYYNANKAD